MTLGKYRLQNKFLTIQFFAAEKHWSVRLMCKLLRVARASYYKWLKYKDTRSNDENILIAQLIREYDIAFNHILGYRRMTSWINRLNNKSYSKNRIHRIMRKLGIKSVIRRKRNKYLYYPTYYLPENFLRRNFNASKPNEKWLTDVTEFKWYANNMKHKLYLSVIMDLYDRSIIAYVVSNRNNNAITLSTFEKAIKSNPTAKPIFHSDRGFNYTNQSFQFRVITQGMTPSLSRKGHCIDNGPMEGFWGIIKSEMYNLRSFENESELKKAIDEYIHFYNNERFQDRFGTRTPMEVRTEAMNAEVPTVYPIAENKRIQKFKESLRAS